MKSDMIAEIMIRAAEVDRKLPDTARPAKLKAMNLGFVHTFADMNQWHEEEKHAANWAWLSPENLKATTNDVGIWEAAMEMMKLVPVTNKRRALWAWARAEAKTLTVQKLEEVEINTQEKFNGRASPIIVRDVTAKRLSFRRWCLDVEHILPATGNWRKNAAISSIELAFNCNVLLHNDNDADPDFTNCPEIEHKKSNIEVWRPDDATPMACYFDTNISGFEWAEAQNERRRQREARKRRQAAA